MELLVFGIVFPWLSVALGCWLSYQLVHQNGRILLRLEALERQVSQLGGAPVAAPAVLALVSGAAAPTNGKAAPQRRKGVVPMRR
jgi:hypothetical protein